MSEGAIRTKPLVRWTLRVRQAERRGVVDIYSAERCPRKSPKKLSTGPFGGGIRYCAEVDWKSSVVVKNHKDKQGLKPGSWDHEQVR